MDAPALQDLRILVVDDDRDSRDMMLVALETEGAQVISVGSVQSAFEALMNWQPDLIISDIRMPDADGYGFLQSLRSKGFKMPAIAVTAFARDEDRRDALEAGYQCHLPKPIDLDLLYRTIVELMTC
jgi:two-component system, OmpR family, response regulator